MSHSSALPVTGTNDPVSNVLKWILLAVAVATFALLAWATVLTYERAPPQPDRFVGPGGTVLMTADDIFAGKAGFPEGRPDGLRQPLRHGLVLRPGLHRLGADAPRQLTKENACPGAVSASRSKPCRPTSRRRCAMPCGAACSAWT